MTCTRLNIVGRRSWAAPIKSGQLQRRKGEAEKASRHPCAIPNRYGYYSWTDPRMRNPRNYSILREKYYEAQAQVNSAWVAKKSMVDGMKKNFLSQINSLSEPIPMTAKSIFFCTVSIHCCSMLLPPVPLLKKVAESYGKNFGALKLVNFWHPLSSLYMLPQVLLYSAPFLYEKGKTFGNVYGYT